MQTNNPLTLEHVNTMAAALWQLPAPSALVILGPPGTAKTAFTKHTLPHTLARALGIPREGIAYLSFLASERDPADVAGMALPARTDAGDWHTHYSRSPLLCEIDRALAAPGIQHLLLNIDELTQCAPEMQRGLRGVLDAETRTIGAHQLPANVTVVATGNRLSDKAGSIRMLSHMANAVARVTIAHDIPAWQQWAEAQSDTAAPIHPTLIGAAGALSEYAFFVDAVPVEDSQYCTPRSYSRAAQALTAMAGGAHAATIPTNPAASRLTAALIGPAAAEQLLTYIEQLGHVPTAAEIQADPERARVDDSTHYQHAAAQVALASATDRDSAEQALCYITRLRPDLQISTVAQLMRRSARQGWRVGGPQAQRFIQQYSDLLPLTEGSAATAATGTSY